MKVLLATVILVCYAICVHGLRVKRGLSTEEQKKLMDELKKDRAEMAKKAGIEFGELTYDPNLEKGIDSIKDCMIGRGTQGVSLKYNSVGQQLFEYVSSNLKGFHFSLALFDPSSYKIGCSKTFKCSFHITKNDSIFPAEFHGKTMKAYGACKTSLPEKKNTTGELIKIHEAGLPHPSKYGDIIGVVGSSGRVFSLILSLFLVFYL